MNIGTKSVLFGVHAFWLHPFFVARAWTQLYGFPLDPRLWVAFFVHDLGYWGKPNMDGPEGERHVELGANIMRLLFDKGCQTKWRDFCLFHSRYYAKAAGVAPSRLCIADKLSFAVTPKRLYLLLANLTGEVHEYMERAKTRAETNVRLSPKERSNVLSTSQSDWFDGVRDYMLRWVAQHKGGGEDNWTLSAITSAPSKPQPPSA